MFVVAIAGFLVAADPVDVVPDRVGSGVVVGATVGLGPVSAIAPSPRVDVNVEVGLGDVVGVVAGANFAGVGSSLFRAGASVGVVGHVDVGAFEFAGGVVVVGGVGTLLVTDIAPPLVADIGAGPVASLRWRMTDTVDLRGDIGVPLAVFFQQGRPLDEAILFPQPSAGVGVGFRF